VEFIDISEQRNDAGERCGPRTDQRLSRRVPKIMGSFGKLPGGLSGGVIIILDVVSGPIRAE